jgi:hypothetical protein
MTGASIAHPPPIMSLRFITDGQEDDAPPERQDHPRHRSDHRRRRGRRRRGCGCADVPVQQHPEGGAERTRPGGTATVTQLRPRERDACPDTLAAAAPRQKRSNTRVRSLGGTPGACVRDLDGGPRRPVEFTDNNGAGARFIVALPIG